MNFLIIGEACTDIFIYGKSERLSPEAPVPVFVPISRTENRGMAANVSENLKSLIKKNNASSSITEWFSDESRIIKTRYVDKKSNHIFIRVDEEKDVKYKYDDAKLYRHINQPRLMSPFIEASNIIIVSDYNKGYLSDDDLQNICKQAGQRTLFLDSKRHITKEILEGFSFIKLNEQEAERASDLIKDYPEKVIITLGGKGTAYKNKIYGVQEVETIDVSGAGDTFVAALAFKYSETTDIVQSIEYANQMASIVVTKRGVSVI